MTIFKRFTFDSSHFLPLVPEGHKCREVHKHTYHLTIFIEGPVEAMSGWVADFTDIKRQVWTTLEIIDHKLLNNIEGLENPTCELLTVWLWNKMIKTFPLLKRIELHETPTTGVIYEGS